MEGNKMVELLERINEQEQYTNVALAVFIQPMNSTTSAKANMVENGQNLRRHSFKVKQKKSKDKKFNLGTKSEISKKLGPKDPQGLHGIVKIVVKQATYLMLVGLLREMRSMWWMKSLMTLTTLTCRLLYSRCIWLIPNLETGGWIHTPPSMFARTTKCFSTLKQLILGKACTWRTHPRPSSRAKEVPNILKMTTGKNMTLKNMLYYPYICRNMILRSLLNKNDSRHVLESNEFILSENGLHMGKGYECGRMFKMKIIVVKPKVSKNKNVSYAYLIESPYLLHSRLG